MGNMGTGQAVSDAMMELVTYRDEGAAMATRKKARKRDEALAGTDDGCESWLVEGARFDGMLEIPVIRRP